MFITISDVEDNGLSVETVEEGVVIEQVTRTYDGQGYTTVTITFLDEYRKEDEEEDGEDIEATDADSTPNPFFHLAGPDPYVEFPGAYGFMDGIGNRR